MFKKSGDVVVTGKPITVKDSGNRGRGTGQKDEDKREDRKKDKAK